jgi:hypothetical protein
MLRCQTCGSRQARREWCCRCRNPNPFAGFRRLLTIAVVLVAGVAMFLALLAYQRTQALGLAPQESGGVWQGISLVRHEGGADVHAMPQDTSRRGAGRGVGVKARGSLSPCRSRACRTPLVADRRAALVGSLTKQSRAKRQRQRQRIGERAVRRK